jgi:hypothetical protein
VGSAGSKLLDLDDECMDDIVGVGESMIDVYWL